MYQYRPLDRNSKEIRLLTLEPGFGDSMLSCILTHEVLDSPALPSYETISYVCGDQTTEATINLHNGEFKIPATAEAALRCMRLEDKRRILWIDAICIDGNNIVERNHQVGMMYALYTKTFHNCIYLGPDDSMMVKFKATVEETKREMACRTQNHDQFVKMLSVADAGYHRLDDATGELVRESGLREFFSNPWFKRLWVVQEASLSPESTCYVGEHRIPLNDVLLTARWLALRLTFDPNSEINSFADNLKRAAIMFGFADKRYGQSFSKNVTLSDCLAVFHEFSTYDRKDQVFAIIGMWQKYAGKTGLPTRLKPDYNLDVSQIFTNATRFAIEERQNLSLLETISVSQHGKEREGWPSWVPVLDYKSGADFRPQSLPHRHNADDRRNIQFLSPAAGANTLQLGGILVDRVIDVNIAMLRTPYMRFGGVAPGVVAMENLLKSMEMPRPQHSWVRGLGGDNETRAATVLVGGSKVGDSGTGDTDEKTLSSYRSFKHYLKFHRKFPPGFGENPFGGLKSRDQDLAERYGLAWTSRASHRAILHTKHGLIGLGPECTQPGDFVAILYGCSFPVVIRRLRAPGDYKFLEVCYVYGIMDGEAVRRNEEMNRKDDSINLI